jgi:hypothetical protein
MGGLEGEGDANPAGAWLPTSPAGEGRHRPTSGLAGAGPAGFFMLAREDIFWPSLAVELFFNILHI